MEKGYEKVSLEHVAKACHITKASVYYYYGNKSVLFTDCILFVLKLAYDQTSLILHGPGTLKDRLLNVAERHMHTAHIEFETMMREAAHGLTEEQVARIRSGEHALHELLADVFQKAMDEGVINKSDPMLLAYMFTATLTVRNRKEIINERKSVDQAAAEIIEVLWNGLFIK